MDLCVTFFKGELNRCSGQQDLNKKNVLLYEILAATPLEASRVGKGKVGGWGGKRPCTLKYC